jgi:hypothetical protein
VALDDSKRKLTVWILCLKVAEQALLDTQDPQGRFPGTLGTFSPPPRVELIPGLRRSCSHTPSNPYCVQDMQGNVNTLMT